MLKRGHIKEKVDELIGFGVGRRRYNGKELAVFQGAEEDLTWIAHSRFVVTMGKGGKIDRQKDHRLDGRFCTSCFSVDYKHSYENKS